MVVEESCSLVDIYAGIRDGTVKVPSAKRNPSPEVNKTACSNAHRFRNLTAKLSQY